MFSYFFVIFALTVVGTRIFLYMQPTSSPMIGGFRLHHYMYGIVGILVGFFASSIAIYAIGLGLFVDELTYLFIRGKSHEDNYSALSLLGTVFFVLLVFLFQNLLLLPFGK